MNKVNFDNKTIKNVIRICDKILKNEDKVKESFLLCKSDLLSEIKSTRNKLEEIQHIPVEHLTYLDIDNHLSFQLEWYIKSEFDKYAHILTGNEAHCLLSFIDNFKSFYKEIMYYTISVNIGSGKSYEDMHRMLKDYCTSYKTDGYRIYLFDNEQKCRAVISEFTEYIMTHLECPAYFLSTRTMLVKNCKKLVRNGV